MTVNQNLIEIVKIANNIVLDIYNKSEHKVTIKDDNSPLTEADRKSSEFICQYLRIFYPDIPIICEETKMVEYEKRKNWYEFWLVDPLDGTKEFINRNGEFTVNIGLIRNGEPVIGIVGVPCEHVIYYASKGSGAYKLNLKNNQREKLECKPFALSDDLTFVCSRSHMDEKTEKFLNTFNVKEKISAGSSLKFMYLCENKAQIYPRYIPTMEWDTAASDAILREAGGRIETWDHQILAYNKENMKNDNLIAYGNILE